MLTIYPRNCSFVTIRPMQARNCVFCARIFALLIAVLSRKSRLQVVAVAARTSFTNAQCGLAWEIDVAENLCLVKHS